MDCVHYLSRQINDRRLAATLANAGVKQIWPASSLRDAGRCYGAKSRHKNLEMAQNIPSATRESRISRVCFFDATASSFAVCSSAKVLESVGTNSGGSIGAGKREARFGAVILSEESAANNSHCPKRLDCCVPFAKPHRMAN